MSRMLRGQATLQSIIGKSSITKRAGNVQKRLKQNARASGEASAPAAVPAEAVPEAASDAHHEDEAPAELAEGYVRCPVCATPLRGDDAHVNLHLGAARFTLDALHRS